MSMPQMRCCNTGGCACGPRPVRETCNYCYSLVGDPCFGGLCCDELPKISYKPFIPSYEPVLRRPKYSEKNVWHVWKVFANHMDKSNCCYTTVREYIK